MRKIDRKIADRDYAKTPLTEAEVGAILDAAGSPLAVMNTRHEVARTRGWKENPPSNAEFAAAVLETPNLLRRPIVLSGESIVVGNDPEGWKRVLGG